MKTFTITSFIKSTRLGINSFLALFILILLSTNASGQAGNIDQIRNGPKTDPSKNFYDNFNNPTWVNGNAGSSNAHYVEGMSIGYRSLLTGLVTGTTYTYVISYDTKHSDAMAIDYLTHYQRLQPHGPFGHTAEVINPLIMEDGNREYIMGTVSGPGILGYPVPDPSPAGYWNNADNGSHAGADDGTPVNDQPKNSFNALNANASEPNDNVMTIYNGTLVAMGYKDQGSLTTGNQDAETFVFIRFTAAKDSVLLTWGGHIASRLDWGFINGVPRSAGGISGSPYHMRQKELYRFNNYQSNPNDSTTLSVGNQDRSLSAAAVVPPPECPTVPSQTVCSGAAFSAFTIASPQAGATYVWSFATNTANAAFSGGGATATGSSVTIVAGAGGFTAGGSFSFNITATLNSIEQICTGVASGSIVKVVATASASPTTIDITSLLHNTTLTGGIAATSTDANADNYTYQWSLAPGSSGTAANLTNANQKVATYTAATTDAGSTITFKVVATQKSAPFCSDDETVQVSVSSYGGCDISAQAAVCQGTTTTHTGSPNPKPTNATYAWSIGGYQGSGTTTSTLVGGNSGTVTQQVNATQSYRITLTQTYLNTALNTSCTEDVQVIATPGVSTVYNPPACYSKEFTVDVTTPTNGFTYSIDQPGNALTFNPITPTAQSPLVHFTGLTNGDGFIVTVNTGGPGCTATSSCVNPNRIATNQENTEADKTTKQSIAETYKIVLQSATKVNAVPNPFREKIRFNLVSTISGMGSLELYNITGQKVAVVYQGYVEAGREVIKEYAVSSEKRGTLIYVFKVGDQRVTGKLIGIK